MYFGHANDPDSLESATAKAAWLDEAAQNKFKLDSWEAILRRLSACVVFCIVRAIGADTHLPEKASGRARILVPRLVRRRDPCLSRSTTQGNC